MSERGSVEMAEQGDVLRWSSDLREKKSSKEIRTQYMCKVILNEEPTEFGVVWERYDKNIRRVQKSIDSC
jgi:hypothetical protein